MADKLPGVNYQAPLATDDLEFQQKTTGQEIQERTRLEMGEVKMGLEPAVTVLAGARFGIVDTIDPRDIATTDINRPLNVSRPPDLSLRVDVLPGTAVTDCGNWVTLESKITNLDLASTAVGAVNVVFIEYFTEDGTERRVNKFNVDVAVRNQRPADNGSVIKVDILDNVNDASQYTPDRLKDIVLLAFVTVNQLADLSLDLAIDLGDNNFSANRPWYSPVDIEHRTKTGTAEPTDTNPHGTSLNDLAAGRLTLYQQAVAHGMVLSKDIDVPRYPGIKHSEDILADSFTQDTTGKVTRRAVQFGAQGSWWASLANFPLSIGSAYATGNPARQVSVDYVPDTNILVIPDNEPIPSEGVTVEYMIALAGQGPVDPATNDLVFLQPADSELIVADGIAVSSIPTPVISFDGSGPIPRDYRVLLDSDGDLISTPQILQPPIKLDAMGFVDLPITRAMRGSAPIEIGLTRANDIGGLEIVLVCTGLDENGVAVPEADGTLTFTFANWSDTSIPADSENLNQFQRTPVLFSDLESVRVKSRASDGNDSTIIVYADQEAAVTDTFKEKCPLADVFWDGLAVESVLDSRPVSLDLELPRTPIYNGTGADEPGSRAWVYEDFRSPRFGDSFSGDEDPFEAEGSITITQNEQFSTGDTIDLGDGKVLEAMAPEPAEGSLTALAFGVEIPLGSTQFIIVEQGGQPSMTVSIPNGPLAIQTIADQIASNLQSASQTVIAPLNVGATYSGSVTSNRIITITSSNPFRVETSPLQGLLGFDVAPAFETLQQSASQPGLADGNTFTLGDGVDTETFEFDTGDPIGLGNVENTSVTVGDNALAPVVQGIMVIAVNDSPLQLSATPGLGNLVNIVNDNDGPDGNVDITQSVSTTYSMSPVGMLGGTEGGANPAAGQFNVGVGTDFATTGDNIVATLEDPVFDSEITGVRDERVVSLTRNEGGVANNVIVGLFTNAAPEPVDLFGFVGGSGRYLATSADAFAEGLRTRIPSSTDDLNSVRKKYRSRALGVPVGLQDAAVSKIAVVMHNPENVSGGAVSTPDEPEFASSVRVQAAFTVDPGNWKGYEEMELVSRNPSYAVFEHDFGAPIDKVQFEMFGIFTDFAMADITNVGVAGQGPTGTDGADGATGEAGAMGATGAAGVAGPQGATGPAATSFEQPFSSLAVWNVTHSLGTTTVTWATYDVGGDAIFPASVTIVDNNNIQITWASPTSGKAVIVGVS